jgi:hypothetical protein
VTIPRSPGLAKRLPRVARAYLAGFGTSGSLLICLALMFIVASAMVAFRGWPHVGGQPSPGEVVVSPQPTASTGSAVTRRLVAASVAAAPLTGAGTPGAVVSHATGGRRGGVASPARRSIGRPTTAVRPAGAPAAPVSAGGAPPCGTGCRPAPAVGSNSEPVRQLTKTAQQGIQRATGALGKVVADTGGKVGTVVQQTSGAAAGPVHAVSPPAAGVVKSAGSGASNVIGGLTKTAAGVLSGLSNH